MIEEPHTGDTEAPKRRLVVVVPGLGGNFKKWRRLLERLGNEEQLAESAWLLYDPHSRHLGWRSFEDMARNLVARISEAWIRNGGFDDIVLIGHSIGGLIVRSAYITGRGAEAGRQRQVHDWSKSVSRIILLAAPNRGIARLQNPFVRAGDRILGLFPRIPFTYRQALRGSVFITNLRINWIRLFTTERSSDSTDRSLPRVVQLIGARDKTVRRDDSLDVLAFENATAAEVPDADHDSLPDLDAARDPDARYSMIRTAILDPDELGVRPVRGQDRGDGEAAHVVFILHGIRASRIDNWLREVATEVARQYPPIEEEGRETPPRTEIIRPSYGFFSALSFTVPRVRRRNIERFQDAYTQAFARNRHATFDFIGHSNGTYMLGESLRDISAMRFRNVVLAGSVLPADYRWDEKLGHQIERVRSERGRMDWPVGWLCSALSRGLWMRDVGTGGYSGFTRGRVDEELFHPGGHGSMFTDENIPRMVSFARGDDPGDPLDAQTGELHWWSVVSRLCPHLLRVGLLGLFALVGWAVWAGEFGVLLGIALVIWVVYVILDII